MKGRGRMFAIAASTFAILSCQGCASGNAGAPLDAGVSTPTAPSEGLLLAAPAALGTPEMSAVEPAGMPPLINDTILPAPTTLFSAAIPTLEEPLVDEPAITLSMIANTALTAIPATDWSQSQAVELIAAHQSAESLLSPTANDDDKEFSAEFALQAPSEITGLAFDVGLAPRLAYSEEGELRRRSFGGEVRIGQNFDKRGAEAPDSWYIFAGADGEALTYEPGEEGLSVFNSDNVALRDQVTVGDMQAGVSVQRGQGQLSLSYIRREVSYHERGLKGVTENEDFAGVSFTLRK